MKTTVAPDEPVVVMDFYGERPEGEIIDGMQELLDDFEAGMTADDFLTIEEIEAQYD